MGFHRDFRISESSYLPVLTSGCPACGAWAGKADPDTRMDGSRGTADSTGKGGALDTRQPFSVSGRARSRRGPCVSGFVQYP